MGLPIIGLVISAAGSFLQASMQAQMAANQAKVANQQLKIDMVNEKIKGMNEGSARQEEYLRNDSANRVAASLATGGGGRNFSYEQGISPYNKGVAARDMAVMAYNTGQKIGRMQYEIKVNKFNAQSAARAAYIGAASDTVGAVGGYLSRPGGLLA